MIQDGDKIGVCISGGKDSMLLAKCFQELKSHGKNNFNLEFIVMNPGYNEKNKKPIVRSDGKLYDCAYSAAKDMGVSVFSIRDVLKGRTHACKGYSFVYQREWGQANG